MNLPGLSLRQVYKCGPEKKDISWNFDLVEEVDGENKDHIIWIRSLPKAL